MTNASANTIYSLCLDILEILGYKEDDLKVKLKRSDKDREVREVKLKRMIYLIISSCQGNMLVYQWTSHYLIYSIQYNK